MKLTKIILISLICVVVVACGQDKYGKMSNKELKEKQRHCDSIPKKSAVFANGCEKIDKEIIKRRKQKK